MVFVGFMDFAALVRRSYNQAPGVNSTDNGIYIGEELCVI